MTSRLYDAERRLPCPRRASSATGKGPGYRPFLPTGAERALEECSGAVGEVCDLGIEARGATNRRKTPPPVQRGHPCAQRLRPPSRLPERPRAVLRGRRRIRLHDE